MVSFTDGVFQNAPLHLTASLWSVMAEAGKTPVAAYSLEPDASISGLLSGELCRMLSCLLGNVCLKLIQDGN